jgi:hypothetical protein
MTNIEGAKVVQNNETPMMLHLTNLSDGSMRVPSCQFKKDIPG